MSPVPLIEKALIIAAMIESAESSISSKQLLTGQHISAF
jgi:hypothetical protein